MSQRLPHPILEHAIDGAHALSELGVSPAPLLGDFRIADYVGDYRVRAPRESHDLIAACARVFFEEDAPFLAQIDGRGLGRDYGVALFATFAVVEFDAFTPEAHFLVLAPKLPGKPADAPYAGLWAAQRMEAVQASSQQDPDTLLAETDALLAYLHSATPAQVAPQRRSLLQRLLGR